MENPPAPAMPPAEPTNQPTAQSIAEPPPQQAADPRGPYLVHLIRQSERIVERVFSPYEYTNIAVRPPRPEPYGLALPGQPGQPERQTGSERPRRLVQGDESPPITPPRMRRSESSAPDAPPRPPSLPHHRARAASASQFRTAREQVLSRARREHLPSESEDPPSSDSEDRPSEDRPSEDREVLFARLRLARFAREHGNSSPFSQDLRFSAADVDLLIGNQPSPSSPNTADRNLQRRQALMEALRAYTPAPPIANPESMEEIKPPCPVAVDDVHEIVCSAIDACDEYCGDMDVAPEPHFLCPVSHVALRDPVVAPDGYVYEKTFIETSKKAAAVRMVKWVSPMTRMQWGEMTAFPRSSATVSSMRLWVILKAVQFAGAKCTDDVGVCAEKLMEALKGEGV